MFTDRKQQQWDIMHVSLLEDNQACLLTEILLGFITATQDFEIPQNSLEVEFKFVMPGLMKEHNGETARLLPHQLTTHILGSMSEGSIYFL